MCAWFRVAFKYRVGDGRDEIVGKGTLARLHGVACSVTIPSQDFLHVGQQGTGGRGGFSRGVTFFKVHRIRQHKHEETLSHHPARSNSIGHEGIGRYRGIGDAER